MERLTPVLQHMLIYNMDDLMGWVESSGGTHFAIDAMQECARKQNLAELEHLNSDEKMALSVENIQRFQRKLDDSMKVLTMYHKIDDVQQHLVFLSHYKKEAGTEASLMRADMLQIISESDTFAMGRLFEVPVFLDSEDLTNLPSLKRQVLHSHNLALLLTEGVLTRPWCLIEVVMANQFDIPVIPIEVNKPGIKFQYPDAKWYERLLAGKILTRQDMEILTSYKVNLHDVSVALKAVFQNIVQVYSPHRQADIRHLELGYILSRSVMHDDLNARNANASQTVKLPAETTSNV
jgi:hypothetical protein